MKTLIEGKYIGGAVPARWWHLRSNRWGKDIGRDAAPFDWAKGYDIEEEISKITGGAVVRICSKDQNGSGSCGGQAISYYGASLEALMTKTYEERSAKFIYSQCFVSGGGSRGYDLCSIAQSKGFARELLCPSYDNGKAPSEEFMERKSDISEEAYMDGLSTVALKVSNVNPDIDLIAQAIRDNGGVLIGLVGQNGRGWTTKFPLPPDHNKRLDSDWGHWLYAGKAKLINGKKYIGVKNSWGDSVGELGWQYIGEDYFSCKMTGGDSGYAVWKGWTLVLKKVDGEEEKTGLLRIIALLLSKLLKK